MISPKTALVSALRKASSSTCNSVEDFTGEPDPNHSGLIAFALRFEVILLFAALDLEALVFFALPFEASFFFALLRGGCSAARVSLLFLRLSGGCHSNKSMIVARYRREPNLTTTSEPSAAQLRSPKTCLTFTRFIFPLSLDSSHFTAISFLLRAIFTNVHTWIHTIRVRNN